MSRDVKAAATVDYWLDGDSSVERLLAVRYDCYLMLVDQARASKPTEIPLALLVEIQDRLDADRDAARLRHPAFRRSA